MGRPARWQPDLKLAPQIVLVNDAEHVVLAATLMTGTHSGPLKMSGAADLPATGKKVGILFFQALEVDSTGQFVEEWVYYDPATLRAQLGAAPADAPRRRGAVTRAAPMVSAVAASDEKEGGNLGVVQSANVAFNARKLGELSASMTPDAVEADQTQEQDTKGATEIEKQTGTFFASFADAKRAPCARERDEICWMGYNGSDRLSALTAAGDFVASRGVLEAAGKTTHYAELVRLANGKRAQVWRFHATPVLK